jgi:hypothetical protein
VLTRRWPSAIRLDGPHGGRRRSDRRQVPPASFVLVLRETGKLHGVRHARRDSARLAHDTPQCPESERPFFVAEGAAHEFAPIIEGRSIDGCSYVVVERRRSPGEFEATFATAGFSVQAIVEERLVHLLAIRDRPLRCDPPSRRTRAT